MITMSFQGPVQHKYCVLLHKYSLYIWLMDSDGILPPAIEKTHTQANRLLSL